MSDTKTANEQANADVDSTVDVPEGVAETITRLKEDISNSSKPSGRLPVEAYPWYAIGGGISLRFDNDSDNPPFARWVESNVTEVKKIIADLEAAVREVESGGNPKDYDEAGQSIGAVKPLPSWWETFEYSAKDDDPAREGQFVVLLVNKDGIVDNGQNDGVWFASKASAEEIVDRLNAR